MIKNENTSISSILDKDTIIGKIMKGLVKVYENFKSLPLSGIPPLTLPKCKGVPLIDYKIYGESVQDGTPTPDIPVEIETVGEKTKNLLEVNVEFPYTTSGLTVSRNPDGSINVKGTPTAIASLYLAKNINLKLPAGTYTLKKNDTENVGLYLLPKYHWGTFTINSETTYTGAYIDIPKKLIGQYLDFTFYPQLEEGSSFTSYEPYGYKIPVKVSGKNLWEFDIKEFTLNSSRDVYYSFNKPITKACTFFYRENNYTSDGNIYIMAFKRKNGGMTYVYPNHIKKHSIINITATEENPLTEVQFRNGGSSYISGGSIDNFMLVEGIYTVDTMPQYEPYVESVTTNIYLNEPLRKIGDYADYIDFENQQVIRQIHRINLGECTWISNNATNAIYYTNVINTGNPIGVYTGRCFSNVLKNDSISGSNNNTGIAIYGGGTVRTRPNLTVFDTVEKWQEYLENNESYLLYAIDDITEPIELPNIPTHKGTATIEVDTSILPSNMEVVYKGKEV